MDMPVVRKLLDAHWDRRLPIEPAILLKALGYELRFIDPMNPEDLDVSGMALEDNGKKIICVNRNDHKNRQRFAIAHELGHHLLGHTRGGQQQFRDSPESFLTEATSPIELEANRFAVELLAPQEAIDVLVERGGITNLCKLASIFDVSEATICWRLKNSRSRD